MKLPNGFGSVTKLSGKRRKPYLARVTTGWDIDPDTQKLAQRRIDIGTFKTKAEALQALANYNANPYDLSSDSTTMSDLYQRWSEEYFPTLSSDSSRRSLKCAWDYCQDIYSMKVKDVRSRHLKGVIKNAYRIQGRGPNAGEKILASPFVQKRIKSVMNMLMDYAVEYELTDRNYARTFSISEAAVAEPKESGQGHIIFSEDEMQKLWDSVDTVQYVDWILIQCYMGWRPRELVSIKLKNIDLENKTITEGIKTEAGKDRTVPIHSRVFPFVEHLYNQAKALGSEYLLNDKNENGEIGPLNYHMYRYRFKRIMQSLGMSEEHRPHDPRKTFITMAKRAGVDEYVIKIVAGHKIADITEAIYTERDIDWIRSEIEKIP